MNGDISKLLVIFFTLFFGLPSANGSYHFSTAHSQIEKSCI